MTISKGDLRPRAPLSLPHPQTPLFSPAVGQLLTTSDEAEHVGL